MIDTKQRSITIKDNRFGFGDVKYIKAFNYYIDYNESCEQISYLEISFVVENSTIKKDIRVKFIGITCLILKDIGGSYNQISGFNIIDKKNDGWNDDARFHIEDYENGVIDFYCSEIILLE